jgi:C1A family cysteine protease
VSFRKSKIKKSYGWIPDIPDQRDYLCTVASPLFGLPNLIDLRPHCPKTVYDQGDLGSCTGNAIAAAMEFDQIKQGLGEATPSRLFIYYNERAMEGTATTDSGAQIRDGIKTVALQGACPESIWPYDPAQCLIQPPQQAYDSASAHKVSLYQRLPQQLRSFKGCLAQGYPFVLGFTVYESFESDQVAATGLVPMPGKDEEALGGHAVLAVGYNDARQMFTIRNSWGPDWGQKGYFQMPYAYLQNANLARDFWTIRMLKG